MNPRRTLSAALALLAALATGCGEKREALTPGARAPERFTLVLDYFPNADHAGIYAAQASGEFARAGLDVRIVTPPDPSAPLKLLQAGQADLAISYEPELLLARDKGARLVSVAAIVQKPLTSLIALKGVNSPKDLAGAKVGTAGIPYQTAYLRTILERAGVAPKSVEEVNVGFNLTPALLAGRVDAILGGFWNYEGIDLAQRGRKPVIMHMEQLGVPNYDELVLVAPRKELNPAGAARLRRFLEALTRGHELLRRDPGQAVDALLKANPDLDRRLQTAAVTQTLPVFFPDDAARPWGYQDQAQWLAYGAWMKANGLVRADPHADDALTNEFLPGQGLSRPGPTP
jgi:putative hydroxymethylpyrimidine transport system substrate-binding protein